MKILNEQYFEEILSQKEAFLNIKPFPFLNKKGVFKEGMRAKLIAETPDISQVAIQDEPGVLVYEGVGFDRIELNLSDVWKDFLSDFQTQLYHDFLVNLFDITDEFKLHYEWSATNNMGNLRTLPHPDVPRKKCTQLFYLNDDTWKEEWGGRTGVVGNYVGADNVTSDMLEDPNTWGDISYADMNNECILFKVSDYSWHFIEPINHPEPNSYNRKIFFINAMNMQFEG